MENGKIDMVPKISQNEKPFSGSWTYLIFISAIASLGGFLFGFDTAVIAGTVAFVEQQFELSKIGVGWFGSSALVGCIFGALCSGALSDRFGRKPMLLLSAFFFFISAVLSAIPPNFPLLIFARMIGGVGVGMASGLVPTYISEFAPAKFRGRFGTCYQLALVLGILIAYFSNLILLKNSIAAAELETGFFASSALVNKIFVSEVWRAMFGAEILPAALFFLLLIFVPESPRWLLKENRKNLAEKILAKINGPEEARLEMKEIEDSLHIGKESVSWTEIFQPTVFKALIVAVSLSVFGQLSGVNVVVYYGPEILKSAGIPAENAFMNQVVLGFINLIFTILALCMIDRFGRRPLLVYGMGVVTLAMLSAAVFSYMQASPILLVLALVVYIAALAFSICGVIWVLTPELLPNRTRGIAVSIATFANWSCCAAATFGFPAYSDQFGMHAAFATFGIICLLGTAFFYFFVPETKGKTLEEIEKSWK